MLLLLFLLLLHALDMQRYVVSTSDVATLLEKETAVVDALLEHKTTKPVLSDTTPNKPYLILHYGPAKTGTSTLQSEMTAWKDRVLQLDNVLYVGAYYTANASFAGRLPLHKQLMDPKLACSAQMAKVRQAWQEQQQLQPQPPQSAPHLHPTETLAQHLRRNVPCLQPVLDSLAAFHANGTSLVFSNEIKSTATAWATLPGGYRHAVAQDWKSWQTLLADDWNIRLVLGYRPYLDWVRVRGALFFFS